MNVFEYHSDILASYPNLRAGVILAQEVNNGPSPQGLQEAFLVEQRAALARVGATPLSQIETLAAWRGAFRAFGVNPTKYRSAAEALLRRLTKKGDIPSINILVDICNLVSIRYALPVAAFDMRALSGGITVRYAEGTERFTPLFENQIEHPDVGEVIFADQTGLVVARRWCWRQSDESAAGPQTRRAVITVESQHPNGSMDIQAATTDLLALLKEHAGGSYKTATLGAQQAALVA